MKKIIFVLTVFVLLIGLLTGCEDDIREIVRNPSKTETSQQPAKVERAQQPESVEVTEATEEIISKEMAIEIALNKAGLSSSDVTVVKAELDYDDGIRHYDVEFRQGKYEYEAEIKADDGAIISFEKDFDD